MTKIPVGETIRYAYRFTFSHLGAIIGLIWLPMVIITISGFFIGQRYYAAASYALERGDLATMGPSILLMLGNVALSLVLHAMMNVAVVELALGMRKPGAIVHFAFGRPEWRMLRSMIALIGFLIVPVIIIVVLSQASGMLPGTIERVPTFLVAGAGLVICDLALLCVALRFMFLLAPVAVAEDSRVLERAWTLSAGNFWRLLAVMIAVLAPVLLFDLAAQAALLGPVNFMPNLTPTAAQTSAAIHLASVNMPLVTVLGFLVSPLTLGLSLGAASYAYRAVARDGSDGTPARG